VGLQVFPAYTRLAYARTELVRRSIPMSPSTGGTARRSGGDAPWLYACTPDRKVPHGRSSACCGWRRVDRRATIRSYQNPGNCSGARSIGGFSQAFAERLRLRPPQDGPEGDIEHALAALEKVVDPTATLMFWRDTPAVSTRLTTFSTTQSANP
jgi:hypothetical protein